MRFLLIRHGQTDWNEQGRYQGQRDQPLSDIGQDQARALGRLLGQTPIHAAFSSPLSRAKDTAQIALSQAALTIMRPANILEVPELMEIAHGRWEGRLPEEVAKKWPDLFTAWRTDPAHAPMAQVQAETLPELEARVDRGWQRVQAASLGLAQQQGFGDDMTVLVASHDAALRTLILKFLGAGVADFWKIRLHPAGLTVIEEGPRGWTCLGLNLSHHLTGKLSSPLHKPI